MSFSLRPYQQKFISDIQAEFDNGVKRVCGVAPCGAGKTVMTAFIVKQAVDAGKHVIFFVHRKELIDQTANTFCKLNIPFGVISAGNKPNYNLPVQIAGVQTLVNRLHQIHEQDLLICDECHHILAESYLKIIKHFSAAKLLGVTATPQRTGGINLGDVFQSLVLAPSVKKLIELGNLTDFEYFATKLTLDLSNIHVRRGDFDNNEIADLMSDSKIIANVIDNYKLFANGKSAICYCVNIEHSKSVAERFNAAGISAAHVDGDTDKDERAQIVNDFKQGNFKILCNVDLFGEGFDVPNMDAVILARPTKSFILFIQQSMRALRPDPNNPDKVATIIDCADNFTRFGRPDYERDWSLAPNEEKKQGETPVKVCPECGRVVAAGTKFCSCGYEFPFRGLIETDSDMLDIPKGFYGYLILAQKRGYKKQWAVYKFFDDKNNSFNDYLKVAGFMGYQKSWAVMQFLQNAAKSYDDVLQVANFMGYKKGWAWHKWQEVKQLRG